MKLKLTIIPFLLSFAAVTSAKAAGSYGGLTLLESKSVKFSAEGEAASAAQNEVTAMGYNVSSLASLRGSQAAFQYQNGLVDDYFSQLTLGMPLKHGTMGLSFGYYDGGQFKLYDGSGLPQDVKAQQDMSATLAYAGKISDRFSVGVAGKYLSSTLIGRYSANAYAGDIGAQYGASSRLNIGLSLQNVGTKLTYLDQGDSLPTLARGGFSFLLINGKYPTTIMSDLVYFTKDHALQPAIGAEALFGPIALRAGYKTGSDMKKEFSIGTGFAINRVSLDYAFGMVQNLSAEHKLGVSFRFGNYQSDDEFVKRTMPSKNRTAVVEKPKQKRQVDDQSMEQAQKPAAAENRHSLGQASTFTAPSHRIYVVRPGDTLGKIAERVYGNSNEWPKIFNANRHLMARPSEVEPGQKILIPN